MQRSISAAVAAALALGIIAVASSAQAAHHRRHHYWGWPATLPYSYSYLHVYGVSYYGNCYLVERDTPHRPYLERVCPPR